jgi:hypothetical protein
MASYADTITANAEPVDDAHRSISCRVSSKRVQASLFSPFHCIHSTAFIRNICIKGGVMRTRWLFLIFLAAFSSPSFAAEKDHKPVVKAEKDYKICTVGGYYSGTDDKFLAGLATHMAQKRNILHDPICGALWRNAYKIGANVTKTGAIHDQAEEIAVKEATEFSRRIYESVSRNIDF